MPHLTVILLAFLLSVHSALAQYAEFTKAVVVADQLYLKSRSGLLAVVPLDGGAARTLYTAGTILNTNMLLGDMPAELPDCWDVAEGHLAYAIAWGDVGPDKPHPAVLFRVPLDRFPVVEAGKALPARPPLDLDADRWIGAFNISFGVSHQRRADKQIRFDVDIHAMSKDDAVLSLLRDGQLDAWRTREKRAAAQQWMAKRRLSEPYVAWLESDTIRLVTTTGRAFKLEQERLESLSEERPEGAASQPAGLDTLSLLVLDKAADVKCLRFVVEEGSTRRVPIAGLDEPPAERVEQIAAALARAVAAVRKARPGGSAQPGSGR